jgi:preprotein translocase subunit SecY
MFKVPEIRKRFIFTLFIIVIYRFGAQIPAPGIDPMRLQEYFGSSKNDFFGMFDMFAGGAFTKASVFALGIMPYISASIIIQMLGSVIPSLHKLQKEGAEGRKKITQFTRYGTLFLAAFQSISVAIFLKSIQTASGQHVTLDVLSGWQFMIITVISLTTGCILVMWLGEQITSKGIGNGMSLLILFGIVARIPQMLFMEYQYLVQGTHTLFRELMILCVVLAMIAFIVYIYQAVRKIPIQTPKKTIGSRVTQGQSTVMPLKINSAGVIPIIFASSIMMLPSMLTGVFQDSDLANRIGRAFVPGGVVYATSFAILIILFTYFYTAIIFNPIDISENLKKSGGFIPGVKPGKDTADYIENVLNCITLPGSIFLAFISVAPFVMMSKMNVSFFFGGTSVLIVVGVALDTLQQIEAKLQSHNYSGFMKKGHLRGRIG